jgi:hypothetical protein
LNKFSLTALTAFNGPKLKIHVGSWTEELSVLSTLCVQVPDDKTDEENTDSTQGYRNRHNLID